MSLSITRVETPTSKYPIKCPYLMTPSCIVIHDTASDASAMSEISYMLSNSNQVSFHFAVDDERAVQGLPLDRNAWHAGDGVSGKGNRYGIAIETCYSKSGGTRYMQARQNVAKLTAILLKDYGWGIEQVKKHQDFSGKYCPHRNLDMGWSYFIEMVRQELEELTKPKMLYGLVGQQYALPDKEKVLADAKANNAANKHGLYWKAIEIPQ